MQGGCYCCESSKYKPHFACFKCRKSFKISRHSDNEHVCPECRGKLVNMGRNFKAPRKEAKNEWKKVAKLFGVC